MSPFTCPDVAERLELYAADECDPAETDAIRRHLAGCPACTAACEETRQLMGLLDLRLQEPDRLRRLQDRLAVENRPRRHVLRFPTTFRRVAALAALLLLAIGPVGWLTPGLRMMEDGGGLLFALQEEPSSRGRIPFGQELAPAIGMKEARGPVKSDAAPAPPVELALQLHNTTDHPLHVWVAGPKTDLRLDVRGPGVKTLPANPSVPAAEKAIDLRPGEERDIRITSLADDHRSWELIEPGDYTVSAQFTTRVSAPGMPERRITVHSKPITIPFKGR
jgi:hypothetical protein